jgi:hypothetical protein
MENQTVVILALIALIAWLIFGRDQRRPMRYAYEGPYWGPRPEWHGRGGREWHGHSFEK